MEYKKLDKKAMTCMYVKSMISNLIIMMIFTGIFLFLNGEIGGVGDRIVRLIFSILMIIAAFDMLVVPKIRYERYRYLLSEEEFAVRKGLFVMKTEIVPIERLHKIEVSSGPIFRAFGLKEIKVTTAGGEIRVSYLSNEVADRIAEHLKTRINAIAVEERTANEERKEDVNGDE